LSLVLYATVSNRDIAYASEVIRRHRTVYPRFWDWSQSVVDYAMLHGHLVSAFGWRLHVTPTSNDRSLRNFPMQANAGEMLRVACILATHRGISVCAPIITALRESGHLSVIS